MTEYFKNHPDYNTITNYNESLIKLKSDLIGQKININKKSNILEIGCGKGAFANFCNNIGVNSYIGVDIDDYFFPILNNKFKSFKFIKSNIKNYFLKYEEKHDVIFTSHIFEHLNTNEIDDLISGIYKSLKKTGMWINYMPNADSVFNSTSMRYCDITHKNLYNFTSFEQKINNVKKVSFNIKHYNDRPTTLIRRIIHIPFKILFKIFYLGMMQNMPKYYTSNLISVLKKED